MKRGPTVEGPEELLARAAARVADEEAQALRERYAGAPEVTFSPAFLARMETLKRETARRRARVRLNRFAKRAAVFVVVLGAAVAAALSVEGVRARIYRYFVTPGEEFTHLQVTALREEDRGRMAASGPYHYEPTRLPDGFIEQEREDDGVMFLFIRYADRLAYEEFLQRQEALEAQWGGAEKIPQEKQIYYDGPYILFVQQDSIEGGISFRTGEDGVKELTIDGSPAYLTTQDGYTLLIWDNGDRAFQLMGDIGEEEALQIAKSLACVQDG